MKSFKFIFSLTLLLAFAGCVEKNYIIVDDDSVVVDPTDDTNSGTTDNDGDGVTNQQEAVDNTNPDDPCSVNLNSQYGPAITDTWKALDCDGDGVTNGQELEDFTGLLDPNGLDLCTFVKEHQNPAIVTELWKSYDCDGDSVTNGVELISDNTDAQDRCNFLVSSLISENVTDGWRTIDCDEDGRNNGDEIDAGTDPLDSDSFPGSGSKLVSVIIGETGYRNLFFANEGTQFDRILNNDDSLNTEFTYNAQGQLISVFIKDENGTDDVTINYTYMNNQVSKVDINEGGNLKTIDVVYDGNTMSTFESDANLPAGIFRRKFTFNSATNKVVLMETFRRTSSTSLNHESEEFFYEGPDGDISRSYSTRQGYDIAAQTFFTQGVEPVPTSETYNYVEGNVKNPMRAAAEPIYIHYLLTPAILGRTWLRYHGAFSLNYRKTYSYNQPGLDYFYSNLSETVQSNGYPLIGTSEIYLWSPIPIEFYYEE